MVIWCYDSNGQLDHTFGDEINPTVRAGFVVHSDAAGKVNGRDLGWSLAIDPTSGRIFVAGESENNSSGNNVDVVIWCYDASGTLCEDFGDIDPVTGPKGFAVHNGAAGGDDDDFGYSIAIDPLGRILVAGISTDTTTYNHMGIWRYLQ